MQQIIASGLEGLTQSSDPFRKKTLRDFFKHGRLQQIPVQRKKRVVILEKIVQSFEPDCDYPEHHVNQIITEFHDDYATLRRELIDMGLMTRADNIYRRVAV